MKRIQGKRAKKQSVQKSSIDSSQCCQPSVCSAKLKQCAISHAIRTAAKDLRRCIGGVKKPKRQVCCAHHKKRKFCMLWGNSKTGSTWYTNGEMILRFCYCKMPKCIPITVGWETCSKQLPLRLDVVVFCDKKTTKKHYKNNSETHSNFCEPYWTDRKARGTSCKWFVPSVYGLDGSPPHMAAFLLLFGYVSSTETYLAVPSGRDGCDISGPGSPASAPAKGSVCHRSAVSARWCECATSYRCRRPCHIRSIGPIHWRCSRSLEIKREREISNIELIMQLHCYGYERVHIWIMISNEGWQQRLNGLSDTHHGTPWFCKSISRPVASHFRWPFCRNAGLCVKQIVHQCMQGSVRIYWCFVRWK